ncbi:MAG: hypothetical protein NVSMB1_13350 [Polyangiales bacterium]
MTRILVVGCGFPQLSLIRLARRLGLYVIGADANPHAVGVTDCDEFVRVSTTDVPRLCEVIAEKRLSALTTTGSEASLRSTALVAAQLKLPFHADVETVRRCQDKDAMRAAYQAHGVAVPQFSSCEGLHDARAFVAAHGYPVVIKPARGWGQRGVARVDDDSELVAAFGAAQQHAQTTGLSTVIIEAWLEGREYSVNGWIEGGTLVSYCVTERITVPGKRPLGVMIAEVYPALLSTGDEATVVEEARKGARALGHFRGPCYSQVAFGPQGCFLFETAARMGGGFDADVTRLASGVDLNRRVLGVALNDATLEKSGVEEEVHGGAIAKFLVASPGLVQGLEGLNEARAVSHVDAVEVFVRKGDRVHPLTDSSKRAAYALAHGVSRESAVAAADAALSRLRIVTDPLQ